LVSVERRSGDSQPAGRNRSKAARPEGDAQVQRFEEAEAPLQPIPGPPTGRPRWEILHEALEAARAENRVQARRLEDARAQLQATAEWIETGRPRREVLRESAVARMRARLESLPVIEQAKGIVMAQQRCGPEEAFDLLRRMSQRANVKVHVLAAQIVANVASPPAETGAQPPQSAASRHP
jgi:hypothetical protein